MTWERNDWDKEKRISGGPESPPEGWGQEFKGSPWVCLSLAVLSCLGARGEQVGS